VNSFDESILVGDVKSTMKASLIVKWAKIVIAIGVCIAYFTESPWLTEMLVVAVIIALIFPLGFFDTFIQKLLEYNTQKIEERQLLNSKETKEHFEEAFQRISQLEEKIDD